MKIFETDNVNKLASAKYTRVPIKLVSGVQEAQVKSGKGFEVECERQGVRFLLAVDTAEERETIISRFRQAMGGGGSGGLGPAGSRSSPLGRNSLTTGPAQSARRGTDPNPPTSMPDGAGAKTQADIDQELLRLARQMTGGTRQQMRTVAVGPAASRERAGSSPASVIHAANRSVTVATPEPVSRGVQIAEAERARPAAGSQGDTAQSAPSSKVASPIGSADMQDEDVPKSPKAMIRSLSQPFQKAMGRVTKKQGAEEEEGGGAAPPQVSEPVSKPSLVVGVSHDEPVTHNEPVQPEQSYPLSNSGGGTGSVRVVRRRRNTAAPPRSALPAAPQSPLPAAPEEDDVPENYRQPAPIPTLSLDPDTPTNRPRKRSGTMPPGAPPNFSASSNGDGGGTTSPSRPIRPSPLAGKTSQPSGGLRGSGSMPSPRSVPDPKVMSVEEVTMIGEGEDDEPVAHPKNKLSDLPGQSLDFDELDDLIGGVSLDVSLDGPF